jgi:argininosuccinate lyase
MKFFGQFSGRRRALYPVAMRQGRFGSDLAEAAMRLNASIAFDQRLYAHDIRGSQAHAQMLARQGIMTAAEADAICRGLDQVKQELEQGVLKLDPALEDIHLNIERRLTELIGPVGAKLHTARSRNDQVATDLRLYAREEVSALAGEVSALRRAVLTQARAHVGTIMPGYTHLQRAQPVRLGHHLLAYSEMLARDRGRLEDALRRADECPLGSAALAGTSFPIDREWSAQALGFAAPTHNSQDAVSDRDFALELAAACAILAIHLSRLAEELVLWSTAEFGYALLPERYCSGSSIMPQKVNPDIPELVRAKSGRIAGDLMSLLMVLKALPLAYNKDLQETQEPFYDALASARQCVVAMAGLLAETQFDAARMRAACEQGHVCATEIADLLAERGVPFRRAHELAGTLVRRAMARGVALRELSLEEYRTVAPELDARVYEVLDPERAIERRATLGGPARAAVEHEIERALAELSAQGA